MEADMRSTLSLLWENLCSIIMLGFVACQPRDTDLIYCESTPLIYLIVIPF